MHHILINRKVLDLNKKKRIEEREIEGDKIYLRREDGGEYEKKAEAVKNIQGNRKRRYEEVNDNNDDMLIAIPVIVTMTIIVTFTVVMRMIITITTVTIIIIDDNDGNYDDNDNIDDTAKNNKNNGDGQTTHSCMCKEHFGCSYRRK